MSPLDRYFWLVGFVASFVSGLIIARIVLEFVLEKRRNVAGRAIEPSRLVSPPALRVVGEVPHGYPSASPTPFPYDQMVADSYRDFPKRWQGES